MNDKNSLMNHALTIKEVIKSYENKIDLKKSQLAENDTYKQLNALKKSNSNFRRNKLQFERKH